MFTQASLALLFSALSCAPTANRGPAPITTLPAARSLRLSGAFTTELRLGKAPRLLIDGPTDQVRVVADEASIVISREGRGHEPIHLTIELPALDALELSGAQTLDAFELSGTSLRVDASGASKVTLAGNVDSLILDLSGASRLDAQRVLAKQVRVAASGASNATVRAEALAVKASGASHVEYFGRPRIALELSGAADIGTTEL